jgi:hypothetical protein
MGRACNVCGGFAGAAAWIYALFYIGLCSRGGCEISVSSSSRFLQLLIGRV